MNGHHLVMGTLTDYLSGELLPDTHDERYRQKIARLMVGKKGFLKNEIVSRCRLTIIACEKRAIIPIDFKVILSGKDCMVIKYGPGSLVTRRRTILAASRLLSPYQIPIAVVTNGEDAEIIGASTGKVIAESLESIPSKDELVQIASTHSFAPITQGRAEMESRIMYAFEVDGSCPCDDTICRI